MRKLLILSIILFNAGTVAGMPSFLEVKSASISSDAVLRDRHGDVIHEMRVDPYGRRLDWVKLADVSPAFVKAMIRSEDKRFFDHHGVDWKALSSAVVENLFSKGKRGASTITMQLASLLDGRLRPKNGQRKLRQKWDQIKAAREIEKTWTKEEILEAYCNLVSFRGELQGIAAASWGIFDKAPSGLDEAEAAILAALIRSPNASPKRVGQRAAMLAASLGSAVSSHEIEKMAQERLLRPAFIRKRKDLAPHVAQKLLRKGINSASSTLDASIQRFSLESLQQALGALSDQNVRDGAVLVVENRTGDVLAYVGNAGKLSSARYVDGVHARRQAGSALKPFLYGLAIEKKIITAASLLEDFPLDVPTDRGVYRPENYDKEFRGIVTARIALASSLNIPAVRTVNLVGADAFVEALKRFGFTGLREPEQYGPSIALGTADISLWELVNAYRTLANGGVWSDMRLSPMEQIIPGRRAISPEAAFIISDILSDREARSATFSLESPLATRYWTAVKTGTSKDMRDNWCVGYSDHYTVGVWVGNFTGAAMWNVSGVSGAAPVWLQIMNYLHSASPSRRPVAPAGVVSLPVTFVDRGKGERRQEWFIAGTEQDAVRSNVTELRPRIIYPAPDTIIAIDPDIPEDLQKVFFETSSADPSLHLVLDETILGHAPVAAWTPKTGRHKLTLMREDGDVSDSIMFEVR